MYCRFSTPNKTLTITKKQTTKKTLKNLIKSNDNRPPFLSNSKIPLKSLNLKKKNPNTNLLLKLYSQSNTNTQKTTK